LSRRKAQHFIGDEQAQTAALDLFHVLDADTCARLARARIY